MSIKRHPSQLGKRFYIFLCAFSLSSFGDGISLAIFPLLVAQISQDPFTVAMATFLRLLPWTLINLVSGALIDRFSKRIVLQTANFVRSGSVLIIALLINQIEITTELIMIFGFIVGICEVFYDNTIETIVASFVKEKHSRIKANGLLISCETALNQFIGVGMGGLLMSNLGPQISLLFLAMIYISTSVNFNLLGKEKSEHSKVIKGNSIGVEILFGIKTIFSNKTMLAVVSNNAISNMAFGSMISVLVLYITKYLGLSPVHFGILLTAEGVGLFIGGLISTKIILKIGGGNIYLLTGIFAGIGMISLIFISSYYVIFAVILILGLGTSIQNIVSKTLRQNIYPEEDLGKVVSSYRLVVVGCQPLGAGIGGIIVKNFGYAANFAFCGVAFFFGLSLFLLFKNSRRHISDLVHAPLEKKHANGL